MRNTTKTSDDFRILWRTRGQPNVITSDSEVVPERTIRATASMDFPFAPLI